MKDAKAVGSYIDIVILTSPDHEKMLSQDDKTNYISLVGSFMYLAKRTHPDLCVAVSMTGLHVEAPTQAHMTIAHRTLR